VSVKRLKLSGARAQRERMQRRQERAERLSAKRAKRLARLAARREARRELEGQNTNSERVNERELNV
jgi:hypothetical protein